MQQVNLQILLKFFFFYERPHLWIDSWYNQKACSSSAVTAVKMCLKICEGNNDFGCVFPTQSRVNTSLISLTGASPLSNSISRGVFVGFCVCVFVSACVFRFGNFRRRLPYSGYHGNTGVEKGERVKEGGEKGVYVVGYVCVCVLHVWSCWFIIYLPTSKTMWSHWAHKQTHIQVVQAQAQCMTFVSVCTWVTVAWVCVSREGWGRLFRWSISEKAAWDSNLKTHTRALTVYY